MDNENIPRKSVRKEIDDIKEMFNNPKKLKEMVETSKQYQKFVKKQKNFKLPSKVVKEAKKAYKKNKIIIVLLKTNRTLEFTVAQIINGMVYIGNTPHKCSVDFVFIYKKLPVMIVPEWSLTPIGTQDYYDAVEENRTTEAATIILQAIEAKQNEMIEKPKVSFKMFIWILIGAAILFGFFFMNKK